MSWSKYSDDCPGCKPAIMNMTTKEVFPDDSDIMKAIFEVWDNTTLEQRQAWHAVCCNVGPTDEQKELASALANKMTEAAYPFTAYMETEDFLDERNEC